MKRYLKIGLFSFVLVMVGIIVGSGAIGDVIRTALAGASSDAERAEAEETRQSLANEFAQKIGQPLGSEQEQITFTTAIRCDALAQIMLNFGAGFSPFENAELETIIGNARAIQHNRMAENNMDTLSLSKERMMMGAGHRSYYADPLSRRPQPVDEDGVKIGQREARDRDLRILSVELENACSPLLGQLREPR